MPVAAAAAHRSAHGLRYSRSPMTKRTVPPFRADHVGSFLRPKELLEARDQHFKKNAISRDLYWALDECWHKAKADDDVWSLILTGTADAFCAGVDL